MNVPANFPSEQLSLCMIVRDEADRLGRCLASVRDWVGEMVVVDTGSTDATRAIAASFGAIVIDRPWQDDFALARNASLEAATRRWALVLDADEEWVVTDAAALAEALGQSQVASFTLLVRNLLAPGEESYGRVLRLFDRTLPGMRYRGALHEQVAAVADRAYSTAFLPAAELRHDGYLPEVVASRGKAERNMRLAEQQVQSRPDDPHAWYALGLSAQSGKVAEAVAAFERALRLTQAMPGQGADEPYVANLYLRLALALGLEGQSQRLDGVLDQALGLFPDAPDLLALRGEARLAAEDYQGAAADFEACLTPRAAAFMVLVDPGAIAWRARSGLGQAWLHLGRNVEAEQELQRALASAPASFVSPRRVLGGLLLQRGAWSEALPLLEAAFAHEPESVRFNLGWCRYKLERYDEAAEVLAPIAELPEVQHLLGRILLESGQAERALALFEACELPSADLARGWACYVTGRAELAAAAWEQWLRAGAADWGTKDTLAMFLFLLQGGRRPSGQPERPAEPLRDMDHWFRLLLRYRRFDDVEAAIGRGPTLGDRLWLPLRKRWAITLAKEGFTDIALMLLLAAREATPEDAELYYWLGYCSLDRKDVEDARVMWETCLMLAPSHALAAQGLAFLG